MSNKTKFESKYPASLQNKRNQLKLLAAKRQCKLKKFI